MRYGFPRALENQSFSRYHDLGFHASDRPRVAVFLPHTLRIAVRSKKKKTSKFNPVLESSCRTDEHSPMVRAGDSAPRTPIDSAASPSQTPTRLGDPAPSVVRLDGNFARRRFVPATTDRVFVGNDPAETRKRVRAAPTWPVFLDEYWLAASPGWKPSTRKS